MRIRLLASCFAVLTLPLAAPGEDRSDADTVRSTYESQFMELDADGNGTLDGKELSNLAASDLAAFRRHGLPATFPIDRETFVTSGVAMASAAEVPAATEEPAVAEEESGRDAKVDEGSKPADAAKGSESAKPGEAAQPSDLNKGADARPGVGAAAVIQTRSTAKRSHFVPELPSEFNSRDKNGDGQIALYEWERKKYAEFIKLDKNGDGFLTPAELLPKGTLKALYAQPNAQAVARPGAGAPAAVVPGVPGAAVVAVAVDPDAIDKEARGTFAQMDENKDGSIDEADWGRSRRIRPWFESAGITVSLPMNADTFVTNFRRARESGGR